MNTPKTILYQFLNKRIILRLSRCMLKFNFIIIKSCMSIYIKGITEIFQKNQSTTSKNRFLRKTDIYTTRTARGLTSSIWSETYI